MSEMARPSVFVGSSAEGLAVAEAIQANLDHACEVTIWSQGVFGLSDGTLEALVNKLQSFDFAVLVLTCDDLAMSREELAQSPRDNVLLELGLFIGAIGRNRTFIVHDRNKRPKLPTDLAGVTAATYQIHASGNLNASVGAASTQLKEAIRNLGPRSRAELTGIVDQKTQFLVIGDLLEEPANQFFIQMFEQNCTFERERPIFSPGEEFEYHFARKSSGRGTFSFDRLCRRLPDADLLGQDLRNNVFLTERGKQYAGWLIQNRRKADYWRTRNGSWGSRPPGFMAAEPQEQAVGTRTLSGIVEPAEAPRVTT